MLFFPDSISEIVVGLIPLALARSAWDMPSDSRISRTRFPNPIKDVNSFDVRIAVDFGIRLSEDMWTMWPKLIDELVASDLSIRGISQRTGIPASTICELRTGVTAMPRWDTGNKLTELHAQTVKKAKRKGRPSQKRRAVAA